MDYGKLLTRAWEIIWSHKFLILLGVLVVLTSSTGSSISSSSNWNIRERDIEEGFHFQPPDMDEFPWFRNMPRQGWAWAAGIPVALVMLAIGFGMLIAIPLWVLSTLSRGALIAGVNTIDDGGTSSFGEAFGAAWRKGWRLVGIAIIPAIPGLFLAVVVLFSVLSMVGLGSLVDPDIVEAPLAGISILLVALACILIPIAIVLGLAQTFANLACMIEDLNVFESYRRGLSVLLDNLGSAVVLFLIQIAVGIAIGILLIVPGLILCLCCLLWPILLLIRGAIAAYFSTMWTLAWRKWTGAPATEMIEA
jgi:hypothetical protein